MDPQPSGGSPASSGSCQSKARMRPWNSDSDPPSLGPSETSSHPPTQLNSTGPGASADGATTSKVASSLEECRKTLDEDSESTAEDSATAWQSAGKDEEHAGPISLSNVKSLHGSFIGGSLDFRLPCTATEGTTCQIVDHLSAWNEFLCLASWELQEMPGSSGKLSLAFFRDRSLSYCSPQQLHLVTLLACQLLKTHRCVAHVELDTYLFKSHLGLLSDALRASPLVTSVKLTFRGWISGGNLATAALSLPHLQEFEYTSNTHHSATLVATLSRYLRTTTSLTALRISKECPRCLNTEDFFQALGQNCSLKELVLPGRFIAEAPPSAQAAFTEWLTNSVSLKSLTVVGGRKFCMPVKGILGALLGNRSIVAVHFRCPQIDQVDVQLISKIFEQNKVLQSFKLSYESHYHPASSFVQGHPDKSDCDRCLKALVGNHSLEEVALPIDVWDKDQWTELFEALPAKRNLKRVSLEAHGMAPTSFLFKLCVALTETGADEKVSFNGNFAAEELDERFACKAFSAVVVHVSDGNTAKVYEIVGHIPSLGHITSLHLDFDTLYELSRVLSSAVTTFLGATHTLKVLSVSTPWNTFLYDFQEALVAGLAANTSLREVRIYVDKTRDDSSVFSEPLADAINASKTISRVHLEVEGWYFGEHAFFQRLSAGIAENFTLLSVTVQGYSYSKFKQYWFEVLDTTRRNYGLLTSAADFVRGARWDRHCALALERQHGHPGLVEEVARLEKVDQARAAAMVRDGVRSIEGMHDFMRLAGVVQEHVSCHARKDGRKQLDSLNEDCWKALRRYLKLYDIRDSTA